MAVSVVQQPQNLDMAYGPNFVTLANLGTAEKYAIRVKDTATSEVLATVSQSPNAVNRAQFDLSKIFQQHVRVSSTGIETLGYGTQNVLSDAAYETNQFTIECGTLTGGIFTVDSSLPLKTSVNGVKPYNQVAYSGFTGKFASVVIGDDSSPACTEINREGQIMTDRPLNQYPAGVLPPSVDSGTDYLAVKLSNNDTYTVTYFNKLTRGTPAANTLTQGIEAFEICEINDNAGIVNRTYIPNVTANGGGPNATYQEGAAVLYPDEFITIGVGPTNLEGLNYKDITGASATFNFDAQTDRYWIIPRAYTPAQCSQQYLSQATHDPVLVIFDNDPACNEYPTVQASWLNHYGFRDYFEFKLKQELSQTQQSNNFVKVWNDYNDLSGGWGSGGGSGILEGGETTFNKSMMTQLRFNTTYLTDADSYYLNGLFRSPNLRLRTDSDNIALFTSWPNYTGEQWFPAVLTNASFVEKTYRKNRLFQFELQAKLAHEPQTQRGS